MKPAAIARATMLVLMWSASLPPSNDLILDNHIIYALLLFGLAAVAAVAVAVAAVAAAVAAVGAGKTFGFGERWASCRWSSSTAG